jgi:hypothetical protein
MQHSRKPKRKTLPRNNAIHATLRSIRIGILVVSGWTDFRSRSGGDPVSAGMASSSFGFRERDSFLASWQFLSWTVLDLAGSGLTSRSLRRGIADRPHGSAFAANDRRASLDLDRRTRDAVVARFAPEIPAIHSRSIVSVACDARNWTCIFAACVLLACRRHCIAGMAYSSCVCAGVGIGSVACGRARMFPRVRISFLVARCAAVAECSEMAALVDARLPFSRYLTV